MPDVLSATANIVPWASGLEDADVIDCLVFLTRGAQAVFVGLFERDDGVGAVWHRRAGHDPYRLAGADLAVVEITGCQFSDHLQVDRIRFRRAVRAPRLHGVAVHRRIVVRRNVEWSGDVGREDLADRVVDRASF